MEKILRKTARIVKVIDRYSFVVASENESEIYVTVSKKIMKAYDGKEFKIGDSVIIEVSPYDLSRGRVHRSTFLENLNAERLDEES